MIRIPAAGSAQRRLLCVTLVLLGAATPAARSAPLRIVDDVRPAPAGAAPAAALAESLFMATQVAAMEQVLAGSLAAARQGGDRTAELWHLRRAGELRSRHGRISAARPALREAEALALRLGDSLTLASVIRWQAATAIQAGDFGHAADLGRRLGSIAARRGDSLHRAWAEAVLGWSAIQGGRYDEAARRYRVAAATFRARGSPQDEVFVLNGLAIAARHTGDYHLARDGFLRTLELTEGTIMRRAYGHALLNLGHLEAAIGDPAAAAAYYERVHDLFRERGAHNERADPLTALAAAHAAIGRFWSAYGALDTARAVAVAYGYRDQVALERLTRARITLMADRPRHALRLLDESAAFGDTLGRGNLAALLLLRAEALARLGRGEEAALALGEARRLGPALRLDQRLEVDLRLASRALETGDLAAALAAARDGARTSTRAGLRELAMSGWITAARCQRRSGDRAGALAALDSAHAAWETVRGRPSAPEWRERRGAIARELVVETVDLLLENGRDRAAFEALQSYKARTLLERMAGPRPRPGPETFAPAPLAAVQAALRDEEVLLDYLVGGDRGFVFAVSRHTLRAVRLAHAPGLERRAALYRELLASPRGPRSDDARRAAARSLGAELLGAALATPPRRLLVSPDGQLHLIPFTTLELAAGSDPPRPLVEMTSIARVPSASLLVATRADAAAGGGGGVLAVADSMPGALAEIRGIGHDVAGTRFVTLGGGRSLSPAELAPYGTLHYAGHSQADDQSPWRSPLPFLRLDDGRPATAGDVALLDLPARLAVLSSCETVGGRVLTGEGVTGLSSAFLAAGVPAVVASLWRVEDQTTRRLMVTFYRALAAGADVTSALRAAQRALREDPATRHPFHWAGFVVIGDGAVVPPVRPNPLSAPRLGIYAAAALAVAALAVWLARRPGKRPQPRRV